MKYVVPALTVALMLGGAAVVPASAAQDDAQTMQKDTKDTKAMEATEPTDSKDAMETIGSDNATMDTEKKADVDKKNRADKKVTMQDVEAATIDVPKNATTVTTYYNEDVYDPKDNKIGDVNDLLLDKKGRIQAVIVGVGGFLGVGEKDVAVPFEALKVAEKNGDTYLVMNATKATLEKAPGYVYNEETRQWVPAKKQS
ncbi:MAG: PRC-barrel domain-containing protein [Hyphomicrobiales bacterium]